MCFVGENMSVQMSYLKRSAADVTCEWFESRVLPAVGDQVRGLAECFSTDSTLVRLLSCHTSEKNKNP